MTSHELARRLLEGPDLPVTVRGYEGGVDIIQNVNPPMPLHLDGKLGTYFGKSAYCKPSGCEAWMSEEEHTKPETLAIHIG